jgi:hypothetical protein
MKTIIIENNYIDLFFLFIAPAHRSADPLA